ncbi:unconventional myosin-IXb-like isoform X2 [Gigantopelta aegis]|uniref:unconventional myosin-IXb-like isoform X2 n=1 Tax=Gigantopelta aegis TaxID=1735272 RepID=UPI001B887621|nr:unconventional myosin-IXb-like isoform X2 [Gigantopelta aegis]
MSGYTRVDDLTHLVGPLTEESIVKCLQTRFYSQQYQTKLGAGLVSVNPFHHCQGSKHQDQVPVNCLLQGAVHNILAHHADSGHSQVVLVSGESGSGKTYCALQLLRQLFEEAGGGTQADIFKHVSATMTVLGSLGSAATVANTESTRVGVYIENLTSDCVIYRTKIHCLYVDQGRVSNVPRGEKNYHIFYQMLAGLTNDEKVKFHLRGYSIHNLRYLSCGVLQTNETEDKLRFEAWKKSLSTMGIPVSDVLRVLSAVLLLGNVEFVEGAGLELEVVGNNEIKAVAALLGISGVSLYRGFTMRTRHAHGHISRTNTDARSANATRDALAQALYYRTLSAVIRRMNSLRRPMSDLTVSLESLESRSSKSSAQYSHRPDILSLDPGFADASSMQHGRKFSDGFVGILDLFGIELSEVNHLEQLCINLCAETMQNFYNIHVFRAPIEALHEEGIQLEIDIAFFDNTPIIELISSEGNGILSILENESAQPKSTVDEFAHQIRANHRINNYFFEPLPKVDQLFGIRHFAGRVVYDVSDFLQTNQDQIVDDIVAIFSKQNCNFGFVSYLFAKEVKSLNDNFQGPKGLKHRILPTFQQDTNSCDESRGSLCHDFQLRLDNLLKTVSHAKPHFVRCIKSNDRGEMDSFINETVVQQLRSLQVLESVQLMAGGLPHRMRYKTFKNRYQLFLPCDYMHRLECVQEECKAILSCFLRAMDNSKLPYISTQWTLGKKHIFYSEGTRQSLEAMRLERLHLAASKIQAHWRGSKVRRAWPLMRAHLRAKKSMSKSRMKLTPTPKPIEKVDPATLHKLCSMYGMNSKRKPQIPASRSYSIHDNMCIGLPQIRVMKENFPDNVPANQTVRKGEEVKVIGVSPQKGHLVAVYNSISYHIPYHLLELQGIPRHVGVDI